MPILLVPIALFFFGWRIHFALPNGSWISGGVLYKTN